MYFLLANLSFLDIWFSSVTVPKMLVGFLFDNTISVWGCIAQMHFFHFLGCAEGVLLAAMGYDRYVAICSPLRYNMIMNKTFCTQLVFTSWFIGFFSALIHSVMTSMLPFCHFNKVRHFFCDVKPVIKLACSRTVINQAFSTCSSHLTVVSLFYGTAMCTYLGPSSDDSIEKDKVAAVLFTVITPTLNPISYTLRNKEESS
ncbi:olfactory receptor 12D1-like [Pelobates fuscus]|uniref:olfactory receptor 12D1-like n=1 Tax=Pelobates fuscus TaxID=191477 RepID=UPI002FE44645